MSLNTFGHLFRVTTWGESHGPALGATVDGCPPGVALDEGMRVPLDADHEERAIYIVDGEIEIANEKYEGPKLLIFRPGDRITVKATRPTRMMFLGGTALEGPRHVWWNFVSSSKERIEEAKADWKADRFAHVPNEHEFIPLPE